MNNDEREQERLITSWEQAGLISAVDARLVAFHEASHSVVALRLGFTCEYVDIKKRIIPNGPDPNVGKVIWGTCKTIAAPHHTERDHHLVDLAGGVGEAIFSGVPAVGDAGERVVSEDGMREELTDTITESWPAVVEIAERLLQEKTLEGSTVAEIFLRGPKR